MLDGWEDQYLLTIADVAARLAVSKRTVYRMIGRDELVVVRVGHRWRVPQWSLRAYVARNSAVEAADGSL